MTGKHKIEIAGRRIGHGEPCFIIAEAGVNHYGNLEKAHRLVDQAIAAGASAVKFQTFRTSDLVSPSAPLAEYQRQGVKGAPSQYEMLLPLELSPEAHRELAAHCCEKGILFLSTPFDSSSADFLEELGVPLFKIPSGEITNLPFLSHVGRKGKPIILSTGMATLDEVTRAIETLKQAGSREIVALHCVSNYPADSGDVNLRAMKTMENALHLPIGYSDHTLGIEIALAAVALGACVIEKHFTLDKNLPGPDHRASLDSDELTALVSGIRRIEKSLGHGEKIPAPSEAKMASVARRSLVAAKDIPAGTILREDLIAIKRPGTGLSPVMISQLVGRTVRVRIPAGTLFQWEMLV